MKKLLLTFVALVCATVSYAQQQLVATLTHGDEITMFYGTYAYRDAMNAAVDGDVINLSGGNFQATTINKAVSLRGAGVEANQPTFIVGGFDINIPEECTERLTMEGCNVSDGITIKGTLNNAYFFKSLMGYVQAFKDTNVRNTIFANCQIKSVNSNGTNSTISFHFLNSFIGCFNNQSNDNAKADFVNCIIKPSDYIYDKTCNANEICNSTLLNCILVNNLSYCHWRPLPATSSAFNCLAVSVGGGDAFSNISAGQNNQNLQDIAVFTDSDYMKDLTDEAKAAFLGTDGTPVGMYGGPLPFSFTPTYPQITKMNVASKTTADGRLSVDIEVSAAQ